MQNINEYSLYNPTRKKRNFDFRYSDKKYKAL